MTKKLVLFAAVALLSTSSADAGVVKVGSGAIFDLGSAALDLGCVDLDVSGDLAVGQGAITGIRDLMIAPSGAIQGEQGSIAVTGHWNNQGSFLAGAGSVSLEDGCGVGSADVLGSTTFANVAFTSTIGKILSFEAGSTQTITGAYSFAGTPDSLLSIRSTVWGSEAFLDVSGNGSVAGVDVEDNHAVGRQLRVDEGSLLGLNVDGWVLATAVPALGGVALILVGLLLTATGTRRAS